MSTNFHRVLAKTPKDVELFVSRSMDILERIQELLEEHFDGKQNLLAKKLGKSEAEVSKMLGGIQNFTLKTLTKLEAAFGEPILAIPTNSSNFDVVPVKCTPKPGRARLSASPEGTLLEEFIDIISENSNNYLQNTDLA